MLEKKCRAVFTSIKAWNEHHLLRHSKLTYLCNKCGKTCYTPTSYRDHKYYHGNKNFQCGHFMKSFLNSSQLNLHKHFHRRYQLYSCFSSKCNRAYKWPQDLLRHIKVHLPTVYKCTKCDYSTKAKRLLSQHINVHTDDLPFQCRGCPTRYKHAMQRYRHEKAPGHY